MLTATLTACSVQSQSLLAQLYPSSVKQKVLRIGFQKGTVDLLLLKARGNLEKRLANSGYTVQWTEFPTGPPLIEALGAESLDVGGTGAPPPIFAQAAGRPIIYVAATPENGSATAIIVSKDSPIRRIADLKGKKVAVTKGTARHYTLVKALESAGLQYKDIQPVYLLPADARAAFEQGSVDASVVVDPLYAVQERMGKVRVLVDGQEIAKQRSFYLATRTFAEQYPDAIRAFVEQQQQVSEWAKNHLSEVAKILSADTKIDVKTWKWVLEKRTVF
ncbi:MAG: aliphatic sulfonate ABC transporter substrate-binding protein, partial [Chroococcidiopsidaceae cyanobacterium CP_BM_ER_R8_30]|nr:aliphatic sulfonate ABC transporter substrate-binding protein [Chroococcidiopsidaceae cyanobacterium CP_BM_ER_R8_30]